MEGAATISHRASSTPTRSGWMGCAQKLVWDAKIGLGCSGVDVRVLPQVGNALAGVEVPQFQPKQGYNIPTEATDGESKPTTAATDDVEIIKSLADKLQARPNLCTLPLLRRGSEATQIAFFPISIHFAVRRLAHVFLADGRQTAFDSCCSVTSFAHKHADWDVSD